MEASVTAPLSVIAFVEVAATLLDRNPDWVPDIESRLQTAASEGSLPFLFAWADLLIVRALPKSELFCEQIRALIDADIQSQAFSNCATIAELLGYCAGDLLGTRHGAQTDHIFPPADAAAKSLRDPIVRYLRSVTATAKESADAYVRLKNDADMLFVRDLFPRTRFDDDAAAALEKCQRLVDIARQVKLVVSGSDDVGVIITEPNQTPVNTLLGARFLGDAAYKEYVRLGRLRPSDDDAAFYLGIRDLPEVPDPLPPDASVKAIRRRLERATSPAECDESAICGWSLLHSGTAEDRDELVRQISRLHKAVSYQARYFARFVATVGTRARNFATAVADNLKQAVDSQVDDTLAKNRAAGENMHTARYLGELALFRVGLGQYLDALGHAFEYLDARTIDLIFILMQCSGKFVSNVVATPFPGWIARMRQQLENVEHSDYVRMRLGQMVEIFEEPKQNGAVRNAAMPQCSIYEGFLRDVFQGCGPQSARKICQVVCKVGAKVSQSFLVKLVLELGSYSESQFRWLAEFVRHYRSECRQFAVRLCDILVERVWRGLERDRREWHQQQLFEVAFLAELVNANVVGFDTVINCCRLILALGRPDPSRFVVKIERKGKAADAIMELDDDSFRVELIYCLLQAVLPSVHNLPEGAWDHIEYVFNWLQVFCLVRRQVNQRARMKLRKLFELYPSMIRWKSLTDIDDQLKKVLMSKEYYQGPGGMESKAVFHLRVRVRDSDDDSDQEEEPNEDSAGE